MKKNIIAAIAALTMAALGLLDAFAYSSETGDIRSIDAVGITAESITFPNPTAPLKTGQKVYILVRLLNRDWVAYRNNLIAESKPWYFAPSGFGGSQELASAINRPALGLSVGGRVKQAVFTSVGPNGEESGANPTLKHYTDLYFVYEVEPGDIGLPIKMLVSSGSIAGSDAVPLDFLLYNANTARAQKNAPWSLVTDDPTSDSHGTVLANFHYGPNDPTAGGGSIEPSYPQEPHDYPHRSFDFSAEGVYVKTIDFDDDYADGASNPKIWREVQLGTDDPYNVEATVVGAVTGAVVYVWSADNNKVKPTARGDSEYFNDGTREVVKVTIKDGVGKFGLMGTGSIGDEVEIYMSSVTSEGYNTVGDKIQASTCVRTVRVREAPKPHVTISNFSGDTKFTVNATTNYENYTAMKVSVSERPTGEFSDGPIAIMLTPRFQRSGVDVPLSECDPIGDGYIKILTEQNDPTVVGPGVDEIIIPAGEKEATFYLYALGAPADKTMKLVMTPTNAVPAIWSTYMEGANRSAVVTLTDQAPVVVVPTQDAEFSAFTGDVIPDFDVGILDNWRDLSDTYNTNGYSVTVSFSTGGQPFTTNGVKFTEGHTVTLPVVAPKEGDNQQATITVKDPSGHTGSLSVKVSVKPALEARIVAYKDATFSEPYGDGYMFKEGDQPFVRIELSDKATSEMYAFLRPLNEAASNLVECSNTTNGLLIALNERFSTATTLTFRDGFTTGDPMRAVFVVGLKGKQEWSDSESVADYTTTYAPRKATFSVVNVSPGIKERSMRMNTTYVGNGETLSAKAPAGSRVTFVANVDDKSDVDATATGDDAIIARWIYTDGVDGAKSDHTLFTTSVNRRVSCPITFNEEGQRQTVKVYMLDKDDRKAQPGMTDLEDFDWGDPVYTFSVNVSQSARVLLLGPNGSSTSTVYYDETAKKDAAYFYVQLSASPRDVGSAEGSSPVNEGNPLLVELTKESWGSDGAINFETNIVAVYDNNQKKVFFDVESLNGGNDTYYQISARVITDSCSNSYNQAWSDYYASGSMEVKVENAQPKIVNVQRTNGSLTELGTNVWTAGETVELKWTVQDVIPDITNGHFTISWNIDSIDPSAYPNPYTVESYDSLSGKKEAKAVGVYKFAVPNSEHQVLRMIVEDGDGGHQEKTFEIYVAPSKALQIKPVGPSRTTQVSRYATAPGLGKGHVYVDGTTAQPTVRQFVQTWSFNEAMQSAQLYATGYPAVEGDAFDNGAIDAGYVGARLGPTGGSAETSGPFYNYGRNPYDNFFYTWVTIKSEEGQQEVAVLKPTPAITPDVIVDKVFPLASEKQENGGGYAMMQVEAIFSREYLLSDNIGDVNGDGVPDVFVMNIFPKLSGAGDEGGEAAGDTFSFNDVASIGRKNPDEDFMPGTSLSIYGALIPNLAASWESDGRPFVSSLEIRGYDEHLNDTLLQVGVSDAQSDIRYTDPDEDSTSTLSPLEYWAFTNWCARTSAGDQNEPATWKKWSPERPTDPTEADTDEDNLPDGYEYYFWYRAHVGYETVSTIDGKTVPEYRRLTGRRYNPSNPCEPMIIEADEIEAILDPRVPNDFSGETDTDNDGIPDLVEFEIGTNPVDYDTDGDGLPDGYEVSITETDPLLRSTDKAKIDGVLNPDEDQIAAAEFKCYEISFVDGDGKEGVLYSVTKPETEGDSDSAKLLAGVNLYTRWIYANDVWFASTNVNEAVWALGELKYRADEDDVMKLTIKSVKQDGVIWAVHHQVYSEKGFDPRVGWNKSPFYKGHRVDTFEYTHYDEFMSLAFFVQSGGLRLADLFVDKPSDIIDLWKKFTTNTSKADTDDDGMPDGWELYAMTGGKSKIENLSPLSIYSPLGSDGADVIEENNEKGLTWRLKYCGVESCGVYEECGTIADNKNAEWKNKLWPADPWTSDTDGDGIADTDEKTWIFGTAEHARPDFEDCVNGGGLNPLSMDTDRDGLPDGWELEFKATVKNDEVIANGMNPTAKDSMSDYDCDGLNNWQEYMVGAMRCWRYDDVTSPWVVHKMTSEEFAEIVADDQLLGQVLVDGWAKDENGRAFNPGFRTDHFDPGVYFTCNRNVWDCLKGGDRNQDVPFGRFYMLKDGVNHDLSSEIAVINKKKYNRWTLPFKDMMVYGCTLTDAKGNPVKPRKYISCNPREPDTDFDGMDDYFELYHGLNPLLGIAGNSTSKGLAFDVVFDAYYNEKDGVITPWSAKNNYWLCGNMVLNTPMGGDIRVKPLSDGSTLTVLDFYQFPWLAGLADADPDGDNIRNQQEAIMPYLQAASTYQHIDPSPLWMTDSSYTNSITYRFYGAKNPDWSDAGVYGAVREKATFLYKKPCDKTPKVYNLADFPWLSYDEKSGAVVLSSYSMNLWDCGDTLFDYEENEGYDTDHDYLSDFEEAQGRSKPASDPQRGDDPIRRQAMWFNGTDAFLQTPLEVDREAPVTLADAEKHMNYLYYTVEAWVMPDASLLVPDGKLHTVVERAVLGGESGPADEVYLRKNFLIGLKDGHWYTKFDSSGTDSGQSVEIVDVAFATNGWTHVAATFGPDNDHESDAIAKMALRLYVNGVCVKMVRTAIQPERGIVSLSQDNAGRLTGLIYRAINGKTPASILVGASAATLNGIMFNQAWEFRNIGYSKKDAANIYGLADQTTYDDYGSFFKGYIDEVRIWDGARKAEDILADVENRVRYTKETVEANRSAVYSAWAEGARRTAENQLGRSLPAELMCHWTFDHLPGAAVLGDVLTTPAGFTTPETMPDARAIWSRPEGWTCAWWESAEVRSTVYADTSWVPWINNTVAHMPRFDGTTGDSVYWTEMWGGASDAVSLGFPSFSFPRTGEPVSRAVQQIYYRYVSADGGDGGDGNGESKMATQASRWNAWKADAELSSKYRFALRGSLVEGADLLPMGGAFPKRISTAEGGMWDDATPADAWAQTGVDIDNNGLPDWWEEYARKNYSGSLPPWADFTRDTVIRVNGVEMPAWQVYLRDLARGMLGDGKFYPEYVNSRDIDNDGMPDWWEDLYSIGKGDSSDRERDSDGDGLSDFQEYLISEYFGYALCNPTKAKTDGVTPDYFIKVGELYLGEIFTDHDQVDNVWECLFDNDYVNSTVYDSLRDRDSDGWSNYAECKANTDPTIDVLPGIGGYTLAEHPIPVIAATVRSSEALRADIVVKAWNEAADPLMSGDPDAIWTIGGAATIQKTGSSSTSATGSSAENTTHSHEKFIGRKPSESKSVYLTGGAIVEGSVKLQMLDTGYNYAGLDKNRAFITRNMDGSPDTAPWVDCIYDRSGKLFRRSQTLGNEDTVVGSIDYRTGVITVDFGNEVLRGLALWDSGETFTYTLHTQDEDETDGAWWYYSADTGYYWYDVTGHWYYRLNQDESFVRVTWDAVGSALAGVRTYYLTDADNTDKKNRGYVREGKNTFVCFADEDGDGEYTPGEPYGFVSGVDVGWSGAKFELELTRTSPVFARINVTDGSSDRAKFWGTDIDDVTQSSDSDNQGGQSSDAEVVALSGGSHNHVRIVPYLVAGTRTDTGDWSRRYVECIKCVPNRVVAEFDVNTDTHRYITEADIIRNGKLDIDWDGFATSAFANNAEIMRAVGDVTAVKYRIVLGSDGPVGPVYAGDTTTVVRAFSTLVERRFETTANRTTPSALELDHGSVLYSARPTFKWRLDEPTEFGASYVPNALSLGCSYTAFQIQVADRTKGTVVYDSGVLRAPVKDDDGYFIWTAPLSAGDQTTLAKIFSRAGDWKWRVAMYNSKFKPTTLEALNGWSAYSEFSTAVNQQHECDDHGYCSLSTRVKYAGPSLVLAKCDNLGATEGIVRVEAFSTPDFSGEPLAQTFATNKTSLTEMADKNANAVICGLQPGKYYVRAFVDSNGNRVKDDWESWGAANGPVTVFADKSILPVDVYIEDADTDGDWLPDAYEYAKNGNLSAEGPKVDPEGRIVLKTEVYNAVTSGSALFPKNLPSTSLTLFENLEAAALLLDLGSDAATDTIAAIREAVERKVTKGSLKVTGIKAANRQVEISVAANVEDSPAGALLAPVYSLPKTSTVTLSVYTKGSLVDKDWIWVNDYPVEVSNSLDTTVTVDVNEDMSNGFYKVEVSE